MSTTIRSRMIALSLIAIAAIAAFVSVLVPFGPGGTLVARIVAIVLFFTALVYSFGFANRSR